MIGDTYVNLSWKKPQWDGGSAITNYVIEKRSSSMDTWIRCANTRYLLHQVTGLSPERDYTFRVLAENIYGRSDPSTETSKITTRPSETDKQKKKHCKCLLSLIEYFKKKSNFFFVIRGIRCRWKESTWY